MASDGEVAIVSDAGASATSSSDKDDSQVDIPNDAKDALVDSAASSVDTSNIPNTSVATKVEPKLETKGEIEEECQVILDEPDFFPVKEPASIEPMEVPHEDEDAICHSLAKASFDLIGPTQAQAIRSCACDIPTCGWPTGRSLEQRWGCTSIEPSVAGYPLG